MGRTKERNAKIEFIRVTACFLVILNHIMIVPTGGDGVFYHGTAALVAVIWTDVPLFLLISGFLMFQNTAERLDCLWKTYCHKLKNLLLYVLLPSCMIVVISGALAPFLTGGQAFQELVAERNLHLESIRYYILMQQTTGMYSIFWYLWVYARILLFFPLLAFVCQDTRDKNLIRRFLMLLSVLNVAFLDVQSMLQKELGNFDKLVLDKYFLYVLLGYELYLLCRRLEKKRLMYVGAILFVLSIGLTVLAGHFSYYRTGTQYMPTVLTMSASVGLFLLLYALSSPKRIKQWNVLGTNTLYIYMVHILVIFSCQKLWGNFFMELFGGGSNVLWLILYDIVYGTIIFMISLVIGCFFRLFWERIGIGSIEKLLGVCRQLREGSNE
ncbi:MAG: acyltransferase family protein [Roseburia sp.]